MQRSRFESALTALWAGCACLASFASELERALDNAVIALPAAGMIRKMTLAGLVSAFALASPAAAQEAVHARPPIALLHFATAPGNDGSASGAAAAIDVAAVMTADFAAGSFQDRVRPDSASESIGARPFAITASRDEGFVRSPRILVPAWMRAPQAMPVQHTITGRTAGTSCPPPDHAYAVSGLLGAEAEARRRILYPVLVRTACRYGLPVDLFDAMIMQESRYNVLAQSPKGAFGLGQLMPGTAAALGVDRYDISGNLEGAARYLATHLREFAEPGLALAAYNAGPGRVRKVQRIPRIFETQDYVRRILANWQALAAQRARRQPARLLRSGG